MAPGGGPAGPAGRSAAPPAAPPAALALGMYLYGGMQWLAWGFLLPTMTLAHATFCINTVNHLLGSRRFKTMDQSRNNVLTAIFAAGEGWHNNHHRYQRAARNGFYWWEFDPTYYVIAVMGWLGLAWDIQPVPERIYREAEAQTLAPPEPDLDPSAESAADVAETGRASPRGRPHPFPLRSFALRSDPRSASSRPSCFSTLFVGGRPSDGRRQPWSVRLPFAALGARRHARGLRCAVRIPAFALRSRQALGEPAFLLQHLAQHELDLRVERAQIVVGPALDGVEHLRVDAQQEGLALAHATDRSSRC